MKDASYPDKVNWKYIFLFYTIAFVLSAPANSFYFLDKWHAITEGTLLYKMPFFPAILGTLIAAVLAFAIDKNLVRSITLWGNDKMKNLVIAIVPLVTMTIAGAQNGFHLNPHIYALLISGITLIYAFSEEIFWRGYMINALAPLGWARNYFVLGLFWWAWHFNFTFYGCTTFLLLVVISSFLIGKFVEGTKSYLTAAGLHSLIVTVTIGGNDWPQLYAAGAAIIVWMLIGKFWKTDQCTA